jgi:hypothetical protein
MGEENHGDAGANRRRTAISPGEEDEGKSEGDDGVTVREEGLNFCCQILPFPPFLRGWEEPEKIWRGRRGRRGTKWAGGLSINSSIALDVTSTAIVRFTFYTDPTVGARWHTGSLPLFYCV